jgi:hypothetical protein
MVDGAHVERLPRYVKSYGLIAGKGRQYFVGLHPKRIESRVELTDRHVGINPVEAAQ